MVGIDRVLAIDSEEEFERVALEVFGFQARCCEPYREYLELIGVEPEGVRRVEDIPFLPIELFKSHRVYCGQGEPEIVFTSSTTGGGEPSRHYMERLSDYEKTFRKAFEIFYGAPEETPVYALLPGYLERKGSSLIYMADNLIHSGGGGFYLNEYPKLIEDMAADPRRKILLGVSYALWDLAEQYAPKLHDTIVMETGGMKGKREEMPKDDFHRMLCEAFGVGEIHSEYGMAELASQAYSYGGGIFQTPPWMRVVIRDLNDPFEALPVGRSGGVNIIDLANISSCAFIQTRDVGIVRPAADVALPLRYRGSVDTAFSILGRADRSEIRGCNLLVATD